MRLLSACSLLLILAGMGVVGCSVRGPSQEGVVDGANEPGPTVFTDVTPASGIDFVYHNGEEANLYTILESLGGGAALIDYDRDGLLDIFLTGGGDFAGPKASPVRGLPCRLYRNLGGFTFKDVTAQAGLDHLAEGAPWFYSHGTAVADYDNDGWPDLLVTGFGRMALFHNRQGRFEEVTAAAGLSGPKGTHWSTSAAWTDLDGDQKLDLVVVHYLDWSLASNPECRPQGTEAIRDVCPPAMFPPLLQRYYHGSGDGSFTDRTARAGFQPGKGLGIVVLDVDDDGRPDVYVANDTSGNQLYINRGGGKLEQVALEQGCSLNEFGRAAGSMGVDAADYDHSGHFSLFVTNFTQQSHALYRNDGKGWFRHASVQSGITAIGQNFVGFGTGFVDYDLDGSEDLLIVNGHVLRHPAPPQTTPQRPVLLKNPCRLGSSLEVVRFEEVSAKAGPFFHKLYRGRGLALGDLDNDGRIDAVLSNCNEPVVVLRNALVSDNHWLGIELQGAACRDATGARLTLEAAGSKLLRAVKGGGSYLSANDRRIVFGLGGTKKIDRLTIRWPSGKTEVWPGASLSLDRYQLLVEGKAP